MESKEKTLRSKLETLKTSDDSHEDRLEDLEEADTRVKIKMEQLKKKDEIHKIKMIRLTGRNKKEKKKDRKQDKQINRFAISLSTNTRGFVRLCQDKSCVLAKKHYLILLKQWSLFRVVKFVIGIYNNKQIKR